MSIEEIKNIKKLQQILKSEIELREYTYKCCQEAGKELAKHSFAWDGKEKNLVIQAMELNERFEAKEQECEEFKELYNYYAFDRRKPENITEFKICINGVNEELIRLQQENEELKKQLESTKGLAMLRRQCLEAVKELANNANLPNIGLYIDSFLNEMFNKDENCHFEKIKELTKEL